MPSVEALPLAANEAYRVIGEDEERDRAFLSMLTNLVVAIGLIYGILVLQFRSFAQPMVVFSSLPVALAGSVLGLLVGGWPFGFTAFIGLLAVTGIVVNDAIVLVDRVNRERRAGRSLDEAVRVGSSSRIQPVLLTTATTIAGLLPLTLSGHSMWAPTGWVIIGGMFVATGVTLVLVPVLYMLIERRGAEAVEGGLGAIEREVAIDGNGTGTLGAPALAHRLRDAIDEARARWRGAHVVLALVAVTSLAVGARVHAAEVNPTPLRLAEALELAEAGNPSLRASAHSTEAARANAAEARASRRPSLELSAQVRATDDPSESFSTRLAGAGDLGSPAGASSDDEVIDFLEGRVRARWLLFDRSRGPRIQAAGESETESEHVHDGNRSALRVAVVSAYVRVGEAMDLVEVQRAARALIDRELADARARRDAGRGLEADVLGPGRARGRDRRRAHRGREHAPHAGSAAGRASWDSMCPRASRSTERRAWRRPGSCRSGPFGRPRAPSIRTPGRRAVAHVGRRRRSPRPNAPGIRASCSKPTTRPGCPSATSIGSGASSGPRSVSSGRCTRAVELPPDGGRPRRSRRLSTPNDAPRSSVWTKRPSSRGANGRARSGESVRPSSDESRPRRAIASSRARYQEGRASLSRLLDAELALTGARTARAIARAERVIAEAVVARAGGRAVVAE